MRYTRLWFHGNPFTLRKCKKHKPKPQRLCAVVKRSNQSVIIAFSSLSLLYISCKPDVKALKVQTSSSHLSGAIATTWKLDPISIPAELGLITGNDRLLFARFFITHLI